MKKINLILTVFLLLNVITSYGQIIQAEYFWDTDPGNGNATAIAAADGNLNEVVEELFKSNCNLPSSSTPSLHTFNIRVKDARGNWGPLFKSVIQMDALMAGTNKYITQAEYFWDTDPGQGSGTVILALDGNFNQSIETAFNGSVPLVAGGLHKFCIRVKDEKNNWGPVFCSVISVEGVITGIEKNEDDFLITVYPNPVNDKLTIESDQLVENVNLSIHSIEGKLVYSNDNINANKLTINAADWSKGVYIIKLYNNETNKTIRFIKK